MYAAFLRHKVLLFAPLDLPPAAQVAFARRFGEVQIHVMNQYHADGFPELYRLSNLDENGSPNGKHPDKGTMAWHTDGSWQRVTGQATIIYARGRHRRRRRDALLRHGRRLRAADAGVEGAHRRPARGAQPRLLAHAPARRRPADRRAAPGARRSIIRSCARTPRPAASAFLGDHAESIVGMDYDEGRALIEELNALIVTRRPRLRAPLVSRPS